MGQKFAILTPKRRRNRRVIPNTILQIGIRGRCDSLSVRV